MTSKERVLTALRHEQPDRTPLWLGTPTTEVRDMLFEHFAVSDQESLLRAVGDDFRWVGQAPWRPPDGDGWPWGHVAKPLLTCETAAEVDALPWPNPIHADVSGIGDACRQAADYATLGGMWAPFFHEIGWLIGQEEYFVKMHTHPDVIEAITEHMVTLYVAVNERIYQAADGGLDFTFFGNDFGTQLGMFVSPEHWRRFILPSVKRLTDSAHEYGVKVLLHSCGSIRAAIPDIIDAGVDALNPVQVSAAGMSADELGREFGGRIMFVGGVDVHELLRKGTPDQVRQTIRDNKKHLGPAYVISTSHEAILPDVKLENLLAMFDEAKNGEN